MASRLRPPADYFAPKGDTELRDEAVALLLDASGGGSDALAAEIDIIAATYNEGCWRLKRSPRIAKVREQIGRLEVATRAMVQALQHLHPDTVGLIQRGGGVLPLKEAWRGMAKPAVEAEERLRATGDVAGLMSDARAAQDHSAWSARTSALLHWVERSRDQFEADYMGSDGARRDRGGRRNLFTEHGGTPKYQLARLVLFLVDRRRPSEPATSTGIYRTLVGLIYQYATGYDDERGIDSVVRQLISLRRRLGDLDRQSSLLTAQIGEIKEDARRPGPGVPKNGPSARKWRLKQELHDVIRETEETVAAFGAHAVYPRQAKARRPARPKGKPAR